MDERIVLTVLGMGLVTYIPRVMPVLLLAGRQLPRPVLDWLSLLPPAILSALVAQEVFLVDGRLNVSTDNPNLIPALITALIAWRTRSLAWTVLGGLAAAALYRGLFA